MNIEQRNKQLAILAKSPQGKALKEFFEEKILEMKELGTIDTWEETLGRKIAIQKLRNMMRKLNLLTGDIPKNTKEKYN